MNQSEQLEEKKPDNRNTKRIIYIIVILVFVFLIAWVSGIVAKVLGL